MKVVVDTNILCQDYWRKSSNFRVFTEGLPSVPGTLCLPEVVIDETANRLREDIIDATQCNDKTARDLARLTNLPFDLSAAKTSHEKQVDVFRQQLLEWVQLLKGEVLPYPNISHKKVVQHDLGRRKPFKRDGSGYRDYLIWETVRQFSYVGFEQVAFITGNIRDFGEGSELDQELKRDLLNPHRIHLFPSLSKYNEQHIMPRLAMLEKVRSELRNRISTEFDVVRWVNDHLLDELRNYELGPLVTGLPDGATRSYPQRISELRKVEVSDVRLLESGRHLVRLDIVVEVVISIDISSEDYMKYKEVRDWMGPLEDDFKWSWSSLPEELRVTVNLILNPKTRELEISEITAIDASHGSIGFADW